MVIITKTYGKNRAPRQASKTGCRRQDRCSADLARCGIGLLFVIGLFPWWRRTGGGNLKVA
jgi:hypothetical protein